MMFYECTNKNGDSDKHNLAINDKEKIIFNDDIYILNSVKNNKVFGQKREFLKTSFVEFNQNNFTLKKVNSWLYKVTKDNYVCRKTDSKIGYK